VSFALDPRLEADTRLIGELRLSRLLLMNDARYPWVILVPRREGLVELMDLDPAERALLMEELARVGAVVGALPEVEKVNIGLLGNIVRQLHAHVVGRRANDFAWPGPVWGRGEAVRYEATALERRLASLRQAFGVG